MRLISVCLAVSDALSGAEQVFVTMALFNNLRFTLSFAFTQAVANLAELSVSCERIEVSPGQTAFS